MEPKITPIQYTYKKPETDVWVLNLDDLPVDKSLIKDQQIVHIGPKSMGGNHRHPRIEWFVAIGDLHFVWLDVDGLQHEKHMNPDGQLLLIEVPPNLPHAVVNRSTERAVLFELADRKVNRESTERIEVVAAFSPENPA